ncbi:hypothetical protein M0R45_030189 [Rubus argutus]|uniref:Uncharacterized protein n=1 Tax=Rubus argutus TaxID=59490 RepID=A0AAW1WB51_RUBAR
MNDAPSLGGTAEDHPSNSVGAKDEHQPELAPLFGYEDHMELDMNEEYLEVNTEQDPISVPSDVQAMVVQPANVPKMCRPVKSRGRNRTRWASNGIKERMTFNENGQAVEPTNNVARFSRFLGMLAQECSLFPPSTQGIGDHSTLAPTWRVHG